LSGKLWFSRHCEEQSDEAISSLLPQHITFRYPGIHQLIVAHSGPLTTKLFLTLPILSRVILNPCLPQKHSCPGKKKVISPYTPMLKNMPSLPIEAHLGLEQQDRLIAVLFDLQT